MTISVRQNTFLRQTVLCCTFLLVVISSGTSPSFPKESYPSGIPVVEDYMKKDSIALEKVRRTIMQNYELRKISK